MESRILKLFTYNHKLKFNEIEKLIGIRSNKLAYHLKQLLKKKIIEKSGEDYQLSETSEYLIPYISEKKSTLPVIIIHLGNNKECFLFKRTKRPFSDKLSLPGGRLLVGETISQATSRIMKEKFNINSRLIKINSISLENAAKKDKIIHSFLLIFVSAKSKDKIQLTDIEKNKSNIITSDYSLIKSDLKKEISIKTLNTLKF